MIRQMWRIFSGMLPSDCRRPRRGEHRHDHVVSYETADERGAIPDAARAAANALVRSFAIELVRRRVSWRLAEFQTQGDGFRITRYRTPDGCRSTMLRPL